MSNDSNNTTPIPSHCYLSISIAGGEPQTVIIELFSDKLPITCGNFRNLCCAEGATSKKQPFATFRNTEFHRIVPKFMVQGGDFEKFDGTGGYSSFGGTFPDEAFHVISHDKAGVVSMANRGKDTNGSQFFITLEATPHLNGKHVAFGRVVEGMNVIHAMTTVELEQGTKPTPMQRIVIVDCGKGRGPVNKMSKGTDSDVSAGRGRKKKDKKKRKKRHSKSRKRDRRRSSRSNDESSISSSSSTSEENRHRRKRKKKRKRKRRHEYSSESEDSSSERRHKQNKAKHRRKEER